jgi:hypothetical protein
VTDSPDRDETAPESVPEEEARADEADEAEETAEAEDDEDTADEDEDAEDEADAAPVRSAAVEELWRELRIDPIKVALPAGRVGYTLRAYRPASELTPTEAPAPDEDDDPFAARDRARAAEDEELAEQLGLVETDEPGEEYEEPAPEDFEADDEEAEEAEEDEEAEAEEDEEVPAFLSHRGRLLLFGTPESLAAFVGSDAPHDLTQLDTWPTVVKRVGPAEIIPADDDTYELDLVVENLRAGHDAWDVDLLISAGEFARDVGWALRLEPVITALAPGSPLDDLDEALRGAATSRVGLFARRRLRRIGAQQASLGWRTVIGKISAAVDWRD